MSLSIDNYFFNPFEGGTINPTTDELMSLDVILMDEQVYAIHI